VVSYLWLGNKIQLGDLLVNLSQTATHGELKKKLMKMQEKPLEVPLTKPQTERVQRTIAYRKATWEVSKWQPIVQRNRQAEHLFFPLKQHSFIPPPLSTSSIQLRPVTTLEKEIMALMNGPGTQHDISNKQLPCSESEEKALKAMDHKKALERRYELQKIRALQSFYEQKARRQNKIKSKKYRRLKKKAKERNLEKMLVNVDPEVAKVEIEKAEAVRAKERMTLRHHNKSKWARNVLQRGHKDPLSRQALTEQHQIGRELIKKTRPHNDDDSSNESVYSESLASEDENGPISKQEAQDHTNPWLTNNYDRSLAKSQVKKTKRRKRKQTETMESFKAKKIPPYKEDELLLLDDDKQTEGNDAVSDEDETESNEGEIPHSDSGEESYGGHNINNLGSLGEDINDQEEESQDETKSVIPENVDQDQSRTPCVSNCDPKKIISVIEEVEESVEQGVEGLHSQQKYIAEAFANDDVVVEFMKEKEQEIEESTPKDINLTLPGWGSWAGHGTKPRQKPRKQVIKKAPSTEPRQDAKLPHVIIRQRRDKKFARHQVSQLPFPYTSRDQFEKVLCAPVGRHWNTEATFQGIIKPRVQTQMGEMIQPIEMTENIAKTTN
jgi:U3 small nucleolar RNA-associated protein 14